MNEEPPRKKGFWETWLAQEGQRAVAVILAFTVGATLIVIAIMSGMALLQNKYELAGSIADVFKTVLSAIVGALSVYLGIKLRNGER
jgi:hypothetical protein